MAAKLGSKANLGRTQRVRNNFLHDVADTETSVDVVSMADRSDTINHRRHAPLENTYKMDPDFKFVADEVERLVESILSDRLADQKYEPATCKQLSQELAGTIMERIKALQFKRYKLVAVVSIGSLSERPGMQFGSRCLWNQQTDSFATVKYTNGSIFAVAMVYGLYYE